MSAKLCVLGLLVAGVAGGQSVVAPQRAVPAKGLAFDVVSIRQNKPEGAQPSGNPKFGPTPDGYRVTNMPMMLLIGTAYVPQTAGTAAFTRDRIAGLPDWVTKDSFDIDAKVAGEDIAEWQKPASQPAMLRAMLQTLLADRCKVTVHRDSKEVPVYFMVLGKNGPKFKLTNPDETHEGIKFPFGGIMSPTKDGGGAFFAFPMASFATLLSSSGNVGRPIQDETGLTGLYDIVLPGRETGPQPAGPQDGTSASDPSVSISSILEPLGLKLVPGKAQAETLVIDHIERPSEN